MIKDDQEPTYFILNKHFHRAFEFSQYKDSLSYYGITEDDKLEVFFGRISRLFEYGMDDAVPHLMLRQHHLLIIKSSVNETPGLDEQMDWADPHTRPVCHNQRSAILL